MEPFHMTTSEAVMFFALVNAAIGLVLGLIPLLFGYFNHRLKLGLIGFLTALIGGSLLGVFVSVPATIIFTWFVVRKQKPVSPDTTDRPDGFAASESVDPLDDH